MDTTKTFTKAQKAAAILVALGKPRASQLLKQFKKEEIRILINAARSLTAIEQPDLEKLVEEFEVDYARGTGLLDSSEQMNEILTETLSPEEMQAYSRTGSDTDDAPAGDVWKVMEETESSKIATYLATENPQVGALVISNLPAAKSAEVVAALDRETRSAVLARAMSMRPPMPAAVNMIMARLKKEFDRSGGGDEKSNQIRIAGILNELDRDASEEMLEDLSSAVGQARVLAVRSMLFRFEDIPRLEPADRSTLFDQFESDVLTLALRGAEPYIVEAVLSAIGQRTRRMIEADLGRPSNTAKPKDIDLARRSIIAAVQRLAREGRLTLPSTQELAA